MQKVNKKQEESKKAAPHHAIDANDEETKCKFSVGKIAKFCKQGRFCDRIGAGTPIYVAAVLEYLTAEIVELADHHLKQENNGKEKKKSRITPRHIMLAIRSDPELNAYF